MPAKRRRPGPTLVLAAALLVLAVFLPAIAGLEPAAGRDATPPATGEAAGVVGPTVQPASPSAVALGAVAGARAVAMGPAGSASDVQGPLEAVAATRSESEPGTLPFTAAVAPAKALAGSPLPEASASAATSVFPAASGAPSTASSACTATRGTISDHAFRSAIAGRSVSYRVYLPPCYGSSGRRYPLLILMTGSNGSSSDWTGLGLVTALDRGIANRTLAPMVVVMPDGKGLAEVDVQVTARSWDGVITHELLPVAERAYCTVRTAAFRAVGGLSRGGFWAVEIALQHPGLVATVGGHSAWFVDDREGSWDAPLGWARWVRLGTTRYWLDAGPKDPALPGLRTLAATLRARHAPVTLRAYPTGSHGNAYWASHVAEYLAWYGATWPRSVASLPVC